MKYYIKRNEQIRGPFTREQLSGFAKAKKVTGATLVGNSAKGPFKELKTVWESIKNPLAAPASSEPVPASPQGSMPVVQERFKGPGIDTDGAAPAQPAPPSRPTSAKPKGKNKSLLIGGIAGGAGLLLAIVWILVASLKGSGLGSSNGGGTFSSDPALLAEAGKRLQGVWITEIQKTETKKANLLESETSSTTTTHRVLTFRFCPPQNTTKGLYADGYFVRGNGVSQRARIAKMYAKKTVSEWLIGGELLAADPKNQDHKQYILKREKKGQSSINIVEARKNTDGTFDLKIEWDQPDFIEYRGGTDKTNFYRKETAFIRNLAETSNSCEIEWQDGVSKRFKDVEVLTDLPGIAKFTRWEDPNVKFETAATSTKRSSQVSVIEKLRREADRLRNGNFTPDEEKAFEAVMRAAAKGNPKPVQPDAKSETGRPKTLQEFGKRIFAAYQAGNESELMGLTFTIDDYEKQVLHAKEVVKTGDFSRVDGTQKGLYEAMASASKAKMETEQKVAFAFLAKGEELLSAVLKSQKTGVAALLEGDGSTKSEVVGDWKDAVFKKIDAGNRYDDGKYDDQMFGFGIEFLLGDDSYIIIFYGAGIKVNGEYFILTNTKFFRKCKGDPPSNIFKGDFRSYRGPSPVIF